MTTEIKGGLLAQAVFTPGPYELEAPSFLSDHKNVITAKRRGVIATFCRRRTGAGRGEGVRWIPFTSEEIATQRLMATAPDLYEALAHLVRLLEPLEQDGQLGVPGLATLNAPRAALAKAEGRSAPEAPPGPAAASPQETP